MTVYWMYVLLYYTFGIMAIKWKKKGEMCHVAMILVASIDLKHAYRSDTPLNTTTGGAAIILRTRTPVKRELPVCKQKLQVSWDYVPLVSFIFN